MPRLTAGDVVSVHRLEFPLWVTYVCYAVWGACFAGAWPVAWPVLLAVIANVLLATGGLALNVAADLPTDAQHAEKRYLASSARRLGRSRLLRWAAYETMAGLALSIVVSVWAGNPLVAVFAVLVAALHASYNVEPVRLKRHGFAGVGVFAVAMTTAPCLLSYFAARGDLETSVLPIFAGVGVLAAGRTAWWSMPDRAVDERTGMATPAVRYGVSGALGIACALLAVGLCLLGWGLWWRYGAGWVWPGTAAHLAFLAAALGWLRHRSTSPSARRMRTRGMLLVMAGEVALVVVPVLAG